MQFLYVVNANFHHQKLKEKYNAKQKKYQKRNVVLDTITNRNFIIIVSILLAVIIVAEGVIQIRKYQDRKLLAKQAEELEKQTGEIFTAIENNLTNPSNNGETTVITRTARISAVGDILCQMDMIDDAKIDDGYDFSHMFTGISKFVKIQIQLLEHQKQTLLMVNILVLESTIHQLNS